MPIEGIREACDNGVMTHDVGLAPIQAEFDVLVGFIRESVGATARFSQAELTEIEAARCSIAGKLGELDLVVRPAIEGVLASVSDLLLHASLLNMDSGDYFDGPDSAA